MNIKMKIWIICAIAGGIWGLISLGLWIMSSGGPTSSANLPITFMILTLPASIPILISYYLDEYGIIDLSGTLLVCSIPIFGALIGGGTGYLIDKYKKYISQNRLRYTFPRYRSVGSIYIA